MIPKVIHYCWFGNKPIPETAKKYIDSWKKHCPDYEIIQWDESNYDVNKDQYMADAYKEKSGRLRRIMRDWILCISTVGFIWTPMWN